MPFTESGLKVPNLRAGTKLRALVDSPYGAPITKGTIVTVCPFTEFASYTAEKLFRFPYLLADGRRLYGHPDTELGDAYAFEVVKPRKRVKAGGKR